jgi:predicted ATPase
MNGIGFKNMKVFKDEQWFDFKNITILTGTNNSGKSSIISAMQMLQENLKGRTIDDLIRTQFVLQANKNKYGSIENFINYHNRMTINDFEFIRRIGNIQYRITIQISEGIETFGSVKKICATDLKENIRIFSLEVKNPYPKIKSVFNINFKYFVDRFYEKCSKTEKLQLRIKELDILEAKVNDGIVPVNELDQLANSISKEASVYVNVHPVQFEENVPIQFSYFIDVEGYLNNQSYKNFDEIKVLINQKNEAKSSVLEFISPENYKNLYKEAYDQGIYDFSILWDNNPEVKNEFINIICSHYKHDFVQSNKLFCDDILTYLSNYPWEMSDKYDQDVNLINQSTDLTKKYIDNMTDFGLVASFFTVKDESNNSDKYNYLPNQRVNIKSQVNFEDKSFDNLIKSGFITEVLYKIIPLFENCINNFDEYLHKLLVSSSVFHEIYSDILKAVVNINFNLKNEFVSSSRFTQKRYYNFNDNTDFTNFLKKVEDSSINNVKECREFINKWLKEFGIANELILKPDSETGNFKAYLEVNRNVNLLADFGLGTNQLLPIILALGIHSYQATKFEDKLVPRTVVIEEPEANLHPALQSKLADMFVDATKKFGVQIIVETHSEYLIRKMQYLVASKQSEASPEDVVIYYFYKPDHPAVISGEVKQVERIDIDESGILSKDFGSGFFDEALHWKFELLKLKNMN